MKLRHYVSAIIFMLGGVQAAPPKIILNIIIDDLGWANFGPRTPNPPENETPRLSSLCSRGVLLDRQYNHFTCSPSRAAFSTGRLPVHVQDTLDNPDKINSGIPQNMTVIAARLAAAGYSTHIYGSACNGTCRTQGTKNFTRCAFPSPLPLSHHPFSRMGPGLGERETHPRRSRLCPVARLRRAHE